MPTTLERISGMLWGAVLGDALGEPVEQMDIRKIHQVYGPKGIRQPPGCNPIGEDSIMTIAVSLALIDSGIASINQIMTHVAHYFSLYAYGDICRSGTQRLLSGIPWQHSGDPEAKGCGPAIRASPIGFWYQHNLKKLKSVAYAISMCTHAHPSAIASSVSVAYLTKLAFDAVPIKEFPQQLLPFIHGISDEFEQFLRHMLNTSGSAQSNRYEITRIGYNGYEAVALALSMILRYSSSFVDAVCGAANISGHSDAVASITGALAGSIHGIRSIPLSWQKAIIPQHKTMLNHISKQLEEHRIP